MNNEILALAKVIAELQNKNEMQATVLKCERANLERANQEIRQLQERLAYYERHAV